MSDKHDCDSSYDLSILPVKKDNVGINLRRPIHPMLPDATQGANVIICSSVRSGKTNLLCNLLLNSNFYKDCFDEVYVISSTIHQDQTGRKLKESFPATCYDTFDEKKLLRILDIQKSFTDEERPAIAIILDDLGNHIKNRSPFWTLATNFRHYGIGLLIYSVQNFKQIPPICRTQATNLLVGTNNGHQLKQMGEEYGDNFGGCDNFIDKHRICVPERFNFMYCRLDQYPCKIHRNFEEQVMYEDDEL